MYFYLSGQHHGNKSLLPQLFTSQSDRRHSPEANWSEHKTFWQSRPFCHESTLVFAILLSISAIFSFSGRHWQRARTKKKKKKKVRRYVISTPGLFAPVQRPPRPQLTGDGPDGFRRSHIRHLPDIVDTWLLGTWRIPGSLEICALFFLLVSEIFSVKSVSKHCRRCWHGFEPFIVSAKKWQRHYYQTTSMYIIQTWYDRRDRSTSWDKIRLPSNSSSRFESAPLVVSTHWHLAFVCRKKFLCAGQILHIVASAKQTSGIRQCLLAAE